VRPRIGVRVKLASEGAGRWRDSAGEKSKFGLFVTEILDMVKVLREHNMLDCLELVHCHPGSQLQDIRRVKDAINELAHVYAELVKMGAGLKYIDVGGGLGVDYDGSGTNFSSSMNYTLQEYASDVVYRIASVCNTRGIPHPMIVSESGRAIAAYGSVLIFNTLGSSALDKFRVTGDPAVDYNGTEEMPQPVQDLCEAYKSVSERRLVECYHDALTARDQILQMFNLGLLSLEFRALAASTGPRSPASATPTGGSTVAPRSSTISSPFFRTPTFVTSRCSSPCRTAGRSTSCSPSCRSTGWMSARRAPACWPTSPATPTARSTSSCPCATPRRRSSCTT
jgi:arginine decarboxylase